MQRKASRSVRTGLESDRWWMLVEAITRGVYAGDEAARCCRCSGFHLELVRWLDVADMWTNIRWKLYHLVS
ncbi:hypothetical protein IC582_017080 [Cucumis melo]